MQQSLLLPCLDLSLTAFSDYFNFEVHVKETVFCFEVVTPKLNHDAQVILFYE